MQLWNILFFIDYPHMHIWVMSGGALTTLHIANFRQHYININVNIASVMLFTGCSSTRSNIHILVLNFNFN